MSTSFVGTKDKHNNPTPPPVPSTAVVPQAAKTVSTNVAALGQVEGELNSSDFTKPYLSLAQGVSPLCTKQGWKPGDFVLGKEYGLFRNGQKDAAPLIMIMVKAAKKWVEHLPEGSDDLPRTFDTLTLAQGVGLTDQWGNSGDKKKDRPTVEPALFTGVLIQKPARIFNANNEVIPCADFTVELDGKRYAPALWNIGSSAYRSAGRSILTYAKARPFYTYEIWVSSLMIEKDKFVYFAPGVKRGPDLPATLVNQIEDELKSF